MEPEPPHPELTPLGKAIERRRAIAGLSKQALARAAGTSRQQLWRVMTGKSDLSGSMRFRLAEALGADPMLLVRQVQRPAGADLLLWAADDAALEAALRAIPLGPQGSRVKRALLDELEEIAIEHGRALPPSVFELRRRVVAGEL